MVSPLPAQFISKPVRKEEREPLDLMHKAPQTAELPEKKSVPLPEGINAGMTNHDCPLANQEDNLFSVTPLSGLGLGG